jgi:hypothetical protein
MIDAGENKGFGKLLRYGVSIWRASRITGISFGIVRELVTGQ